MHIITFVSTNAHKAAAVKAHLAPFDIEVKHADIALDELQAEHVEQVAVLKAQQAFQIVKAPVLVEDSGFSIPALSGFPGPYTKYALQTVGVEGLLRLMSEVSPRTCAFTSVLAYVDAEEGTRTFIDDAGRGTLAETVDTTDCPEAWSALWRIVIPDGESVPLTALSSETRQALLRRWQANSVFTRFGHWLQSM